MALELTGILSGLQACTAPSSQQLWEMKPSLFRDTRASWHQVPVNSSNVYIIESLDVPGTGPRTLHASSYFILTTIPEETKVQSLRDVSKSEGACQPEWGQTQVSPKRLQSWLFQPLQQTGAGSVNKLIVLQK